MIPSEVALTSYQVFEHFIYRNKIQKFVDQKIVSKECFEFWVKTRVSCLKHPEESFQRVVTAHLRGADSRKPFPADVEANLLSQIRKVLLEDKHPFNSCFQIKEKANFKNIKIMRKKFFKPYGFHEKESNAESKVIKTSKTLTIECFQKLLASYIGISFEEFKLKTETFGCFGFWFNPAALLYALQQKNKTDKICENKPTCSLSFVVNTDTFQIMKIFSEWQVVEKKDFHLCDVFYSAVDYFILWRLVERNKIKSNTPEKTVYLVMNEKFLVGKVKVKRLEASRVLIYMTAQETNNNLFQPLL
eukprot:snap_masked-scaffold_2-processed-gene-24.21-mRNA-1 protein AED:1.00 eAED:1.00 QI:0/0/0/0/1/1/4/0/302